MSSFLPICFYCSVRGYYLCITGSGESRESHLVLSRNALLEIGSFRDGEWRKDQGRVLQWALNSHPGTALAWWTILLRNIGSTWWIGHQRSRDIWDQSFNPWNIGKQSELQFHLGHKSPVLSFFKKISLLASFVKCIKSYKSLIFLNNEII